MYITIIIANDNEMKMQWAGLTLHIQDQELSPLSNLTSDLDLLFLGWHKHCLTWKVNGRLQVSVTLYLHIICLLQIRLKL